MNNSGVEFFIGLAPLELGGDESICDRLAVRAEWIVGLSTGAGSRVG